LLRRLNLIFHLPFVDLLYCFAKECAFMDEDAR